MSEFTQSATSAGEVLSGKVSRLADNVERFAPLIAGVFLTVVLLLGIAKGLYKALWFDEIYTTFISRFPRVSDFWAYAKTADGMPPEYYCLVKLSVHLVGSEPLGVRLPSTIGYLLFCLSLYVFVSRITTKLYGLAALFIPGFTGCWYYLSEGRPYALLLGGAGLAAISWQSVVLGRRRKLALVWLALSLAGAFAVHFLSVLLIVPFGVAELVRTIKHRKIDPAVWVSLAAALLVVAANLPIAVEAHRNGGVPTYSFNRPSWFFSVQDYGIQFLGESIVALMLIACIYVAFQRSAVPAGKENNVAMKVSAPQMALILAFICLPVLAVAMGKFGSKSFWPRYAIEAMFGVVALIVLVVWRAFQGRNIGALIVATVFFAAWGSKVLYELRQLRNERAVPISQRMLHRIPEIARQDQLPIAIGNGFPFMELSYYADPAFLRRVCYLASTAYDLKYNGGNNAEVQYIRSAPYFGTHVVDYRTWTKTHRVFYLFDGRPWAIQQLIQDGAHLQLIQGGADWFFRVTMPPNS